MQSRPARTRTQTLAHLQERRRLAVAALDLNDCRVAVLDRSIAALLTGQRIEACPAELEPVDEESIA